MKRKAIHSVSCIPPWIGYGSLYFVFYLLGLVFVAWSRDPLPVALATGVGLAALLAHGYRMLPVIAIGTAAAILLIESNWVVVVGFSLAAVLEAASAYWLIKRYVGDTRLFSSAGKTAGFLLFGVTLAPIVGTAVSLVTLYYGSSIGDGYPTLRYGALVWLSGACGMLIFTPLIIAWRKPRFGLSRKKDVEFSLLVLVMMLLSLYTFGLFPSGQLPIAHLPLPVLIWVLFRFGLRSLSFMVLLLSLFATFATVSGLGPFIIAEDSLLSILLLQLYLCIGAASLLMVHALLGEHNLALKQLALAGRVIDQTPDAIIVTDSRGQIVTANPAFLNNTGFSSSEVIGKSIGMLESSHQGASFFTSMWQHLIRQGKWSGEVWTRTKSGEAVPEWLSVTAMQGSPGEISHYIGIYSSIARKKQVVERIHKLAYYDILTHLPNRQLFTDRLHQAVKLADRNHQSVALLFLDLDRFKNVNDTLGHGVGDVVLFQAAERLTGCVRDVDTLARLGGDEFTIILQNISEGIDAVLVADKILKAFRKPFTIEEHELFVTVSIGISLYPKDGQSTEELIKYADTAMYRAKELSGNTYQLFTSGMSETYAWNLEMETALRHAIETDGIQILFQPQFDLQSGAIVGVEALARWHDPFHGDVSPEVFVKVAENTGLIHRFGEQMLQIAIRQADRWGEVGIKGLRVSINVSTLQLKQRDFIARVEDIAKLSANSGNRLELEVTETSVMENAEFMEDTLRHISSLGLEVAVDDFGTGYSSLSYLRRLPIDRLKIDQSFVHDLPNNSNDAAICKAIIAMAHSLNLRVIAEGVETEAQREFLQRENCDEMQGYLGSRPVRADEITEMIHQGYWEIG